MTKNLETADNIVKLVLSVSTVILFYTGVIAGPFARWLLFLSFAIIGISLLKVISARLRS